VALALGSVNPLLALAATIETGPGKDADCGSILREAASPYSKAKMEAMAQAQKDGKVLGGPGEPPRRSFFQRLFGKKPAATREVAPAQPPNPFHP
jgi:AsmA family protein